MVDRRSFLAGAGALGLAPTAGAADLARGSVRADWASLARGKMRGEIERVTLLGGTTIRPRHGERALHLDLPQGSTGEFVPVVRIDGRGLL